MFFETEGIIIFDPIDKTKKHQAQSSWKKTAMIVLDCDIYSYYSWFINRRYNIILNPPLRGSHVTVINDRIDTEELIESYLKTKEKYDQTLVKFRYYPDVRSDGVHWWLPVQSDQMLAIREEAKLGKSFYSPHLSIGRADHPIMKPHSEYILDLIRKGLII